MPVETLYYNEWLSLKKVVAKETGISGYVFSHETRCEGRIVLVLPYRKTENGFEYLVRSEITPCWSLDHCYSGITGGWEGEAIVEDAKRELDEEAGYTVDLSEFIDLGTCRASKSSDSIYSLFTVDLTNKEQHEAVGDGSEGERNASVEWMSAEEAVQLCDAQLVTALARITSHPSILR